MLERVTEETENHNGGIVSKYVLGNNHTKSREIKNLDLNPAAKRDYESDSNSDRVKETHEG